MMVARGRRSGHFQWLVNVIQTTSLAGLTSEEHLHITWTFTAQKLRKQWCAWACCSSGFWSRLNTLSAENGKPPHSEARHRRLIRWGVAGLELRGAGNRRQQHRSIPRPSFHLHGDLQCASASPSTSTSSQLFLCFPFLPPTSATPSTPP
jgi:hypothetical protein